MSSTHLFRKEILQAFVAAFLLALGIGSVEYMEFLVHLG